MNRSCIFLFRGFVPVLLLGISVSLAAKKKADAPVTFFAQTIVKNNGQIFRGDSSVITVYAYSRMPFASVQTPAKAPKVKGYRVRKLSGRGQRQSITYIDGQPYYTVACGQYMANPTKNGKYKFPKIAVEAVVMEEKAEERPQSDPFFGPFSDFFRRPEYRHIKQHCKAPAQAFQVVDPPRKSSEQLRHEGKMLI